MEVCADAAPCSTRPARVSLSLGEKLQLPKSTRAAQLASRKTDLNSVCASGVQCWLLRWNLKPSAGKPGRIPLAICKSQSWSGVPEATILSQHSHSSKPHKRFPILGYSPDSPWGSLLPMAPWSFLF